MRESLAGRSLSSRRYLDRRRRQLRALLRAREKVELCLFDSADGDERIGPHSAARADATWCGTAILPDARPNQLYGYRVYGPYDPAQRPPLQPEQESSWIHTRNRSRVRFGGPTRCSATASAIPRGTSRSTIATTPPYAPLAAVIDPAFTWGDDRPPRTPWHNTVIYEMHVRGFSRLHPDDSGAPARHLRSAHDRAGDRRT